MELESELLQRIVQNYGGSEGEWRIEDVKSESVVSKGDNYGSDMLRVKVTAVSGSGETIIRSVIIKSVPDDDGMAMQIKDWGFFKKEIQVYKNVLPAMQSLLEEIEDRNGCMWCKCVDFTPWKRLVLEDLQDLGYVMADKRKELDLPHSLIVLKAIGKFHALSAVLRDRGLLDPDEYPHLSLDKADIFQTMHNARFKLLADVIESSWEPEYKTCGEKLRSLVDNSCEKVFKSLSRNDSEFNVLNHGDFWMNNVMFKYNEGSTVPEDVRFVDFQMSSFGSPGIDLQYLFLTSVSNEVKSKNMEEMLETYHKSLIYWLDRLSYKAEKPALGDIKRAIDSAALFGLIIALFALPLMLSEPEDAPEKDCLTKEISGNITELDAKMFMGKHYTKRMKFIMTELMENKTI